MQTPEMNDDLFRDDEPAQVNLDDERAIVQYLRSLHDLHDMLGQQGYEEELEKFLRLLRQHGWNSTRIAQFITMSSQGTRYEEMIDSPIREQGDRSEYKQHHHRWKK